MIPLICDAPPDCITVGEKKLKVNTDYRRWLIVYEILSSDSAMSIPLGLKARLAAECVLECEIGEDEYGAFLDGAYSFLLRRETNDIHDNVIHDTAAREKLFDFSADSALILASFLSEYGIDLTKERMHWYKFMALLTSLPPTSPLMRTVALRAADLSLVEDDRMRRGLRRAKNAVRIKDERKDEQWTVR